MSVNWKNQRQKADQMQVYLDAWFAEIDKRKPIYKNIDPKVLKEFYLTDFDPIFTQAIDTWKKLDPLIQFIRDKLNGDT